MRLPLIQIDAFADQVFRGNPAAVMPLPHWLPDSVLQRIATENNLSETAYHVADLPAQTRCPEGVDAAYHLRWFTPAVEVDLCGHATLATASYLFDDVHPEARALAFWTRSGWLRVWREQWVNGRSGEILMEFPVESPRPVDPDDEVSAAAAAALGLGPGSGIRPVECLRSTDLVYVLENSDQVRALVPDTGALSRLPVRGVIVTAPGSGASGVEGAAGQAADLVARWFGAEAGIAEDPVTGSAYNQIAPYWAARLGRDHLVAHQLSPRGGVVSCLVAADTVRIGGVCRRYLDGVATVPDEVLHLR